MAVNHKSTIRLDGDDLIAQARTKINRMARYVGWNVIADIVAEYDEATKSGDGFSITEEDIAARFREAFARKYHA